MPRSAAPFGAQDRAKGLMIAAAGVTALSFDAVLVRLAGAEGWDVVFWRGLLMAVTVSALLFATQGRYTLRIWRRGGWAAAASGLLFGLNSILFVFAVLNTHAANVLVLFATAPLFSAVFTWLFLREPIQSRTWWTIAAVIVGMAVIFSAPAEPGGRLGDLAALLAAANMGANLTLLRARPEINRLPVVATGGVVAALCAAPWAAPLALGWESYAVLGVMGLVQMPLALVLIAQSTRYLPSPEVSLVLLLEAALGPVWVWLVFAEVPPVSSMLGGAVIVLALLAYFARDAWEGAVGWRFGRS